VREQRRLREVLRVTAYRRYGKEIPRDWDDPIPTDPVVPKPNPPPPPTSVEGWKQSTPVANSWDNPNRIQQLHGQHQQILDNRDRHAQMHDTRMHQNHRGDFNIHHPYPQFQHAPFRPPHKHQLDDNHMGNPYPQQHRQPPRWGNGAKQLKSNSHGPAGQGGK